MPSLLLVTALHTVAFFQALQVLMQHSDISSDARAVCSLLQTCRSWRAALQQCSAGNLCVYIGGAWTGEQWQGIHKLSLFCGWLHSQAGLVQEIRLSHPYFDSQREQDAYCDVAAQLLVHSLQETAARPSIASAAASALSATAYARAVLKLRSFSASFIRSSALLHALPAAALTQLSLQHTSAWRKDLDLNSSSIATALAQLHGLRSLTLKGAIGSACLAGVRKMAHLTHLDIDEAVDIYPWGCDLQLLPLGLQEVHVKAGRSANFEPEAAAVVALGHLTALRTLELETACAIGAWSSLPRSLTALTVRACVLSGSPDSVQHPGIEKLLQLQRLEAGTSSLQQPQLLAALSNLSQLDHISLTYDVLKAAARVAPAWRHLSALRVLYLQEGEESATVGPTESLALVQGLAAAISLTHLHIEGPIVHDSVQLCAHLTGLTQLQNLDIRGGEHPSSRAEALHLTTLTNLTRLVISDAPGVDDTAVSALAMRLTKLQDLQLWRCGLWSAAALPVIAGLTALTNLWLTVSQDAVSRNDDFPLGRDDLLLLAPLTQLKTLEGHKFFSDEAMQELWDAQLQQWRQQQQ
jgi:hypothetical protein